MSSFIEMQMELAREYDSIGDEAGALAAEYSLAGATELAQNSMERHHSCRLKAAECRAAAKLYKDGVNPLSVSGRIAVSRMALNELASRGAR